MGAPDGITGPLASLIFREWAPWLYPGWNGLLLSFRKSPSLSPPLTISPLHFHGISVDDVPSLRWVNSILAISLIFTLAQTWDGQQRGLPSPRLGRQTALRLPAGRTRGALQRTRAAHWTGALSSGPAAPCGARSGEAGTGWRDPRTLQNTLRATAPPRCLLGLGQGPGSPVPSPPTLTALPSGRTGPAPAAPTGPRERRPACPATSPPRVRSLRAGRPDQQQRTR